MTEPFEVTAGMYAQVQLEPRHLASAIRLGIQFVEWHPNVRNKQKQFNAAMSAALDRPLNDLASQHGAQLWGTRDAWSDEQLLVLRPYLSSLVAVSQAEVQAGVQIRRAMLMARQPYTVGAPLLPLRDDAWRAHAGLPWLPRELVVRGPRPTPQPYGVSHEGAERLAADWMRHLGALDAMPTRYSRDGGIDVESSAYVAQVKNYAGAVGVDAVRSIYGVAAARGKIALMFTSGRYTADALAFAAAARIPLFVYDAPVGILHPASGAAAWCIDNGLSSRPVG